MLSDYLFPLDRNSAPSRLGSSAAYLSTIQSSGAVDVRARWLSYLFDDVFILSSNHETTGSKHGRYLPWQTDPLLGEYRALEISRFSERLGLHRGWDLPAKRSIALGHARRHGYAVALLIDDDIWPANQADVELFRGISNGIAGKPPVSAADVSALELCLDSSGAHPFLNGNYLFVDPTDSLSFFPTIYNDDWLFVMASGKSRPAMLDGRPLFQSARSIDTVRRSHEQEFGELLIDGLIASPNPKGRDSSFWNAIYAKRFKYLTDLLAETSYLGTTKAVRAARSGLSCFSPTHIEEYDRLWQASQEEWRIALER